jgi:SAM-dependent methyltransferase
MDLAAWIETRLRPVECDSTAFMYDEMESQSGHSLPILYRPFDIADRAHWGDRGSMLDFLLSTEGEGRRLLDFGPGDGWPSLIIAPFAREVVGVDASPRRVAVCRENAHRLRIQDARFVHVAPGGTLPFDDASFDGAMAATSLEQTPDPRAALAEIRRVLRPGGRLRIHYEDLARYRGGREREIHLDPLPGGHSRLELYEREVDRERASMVRLVLSLSRAEVLAIAGDAGGRFEAEHLTAGVLERFQGCVIEARRCVLMHPSAATWVRWLGEVGFSTARPTHDGAAVAVQRFDRLEPHERPASLEALDTYLRPLVAEAVEDAAPLDREPPITAVRG